MAPLTAQASVVECRTFLHLVEDVERVVARPRAVSDGVLGLRGVDHDPVDHDCAECGSTRPSTTFWGEDCEDGETSTSWGDSSHSDLVSSDASLASVCGDAVELAEHFDESMCWVAMPMAHWQPEAHHAMAKPSSLEVEHTTLMMRNLPNKVSRAGLAQLLDAHGIKGLYDFLYIPVDFRTCGSFGYGIVNLVSGAAAAQVWAAFENFSDWNCGQSQKVCQLEWSRRQGLPALLRHYRDSKLMHEAVPDEYQPALFVDGERVALPAPTWQLGQPKLMEKKSKRKGRHAKKRALRFEDAPCLWQCS